MMIGSTEERPIRLTSFDLRRRAGVNTMLRLLDGIRFTADFCAIWFSSITSLWSDTLLTAGSFCTTTLRHSTDSSSLFPSVQIGKLFAFQLFVYLFIYQSFH